MPIPRLNPKAQEAALIRKQRELEHEAPGRRKPLPEKPPPCPECGAIRHWEHLGGGSIDAVCDGCGRRGAWDDHTWPKSEGDDR